MALVLGAEGFPAVPPGTAFFTGWTARFRRFFFPGRLFPHELDAAVLRAALLAAVVGHGALLAEAGRRQALGVDAAGHDGGHDALRPLLGERLVRRRLAHVVRVALDRHLERRRRPERRHDLAEGGLPVRLEITLS